MRLFRCLKTASAGHPTCATAATTTTVTTCDAMLRHCFWPQASDRETSAIITAGSSSAGHDDQARNAFHPVARPSIAAARMCTVPRCVVWCKRWASGVPAGWLASLVTCSRRESISRPTSPIDYDRRDAVYQIPCSISPSHTRRSTANDGQQALLQPVVASDEQTEPLAYNMLCL
jgi:hypothetical protein